MKKITKRKIRVKVDDDFLALMIKEFFGKEYDLKICKDDGAIDESCDLILYNYHGIVFRKTKIERIIYVLSFYFIDLGNYKKNLKELTDKNKKTVIFYWENLYKKATINWFLNLLFFKLNLLEYVPTLLYEKFKKILEIKISSPHKKDLKLIEQFPDNFIITNKHERQNVLPFFINPESLPIVSKKKTSKKFCAFVCSNSTSAERNYFFKKLSQYKKVDSYGRVMKNAEYSEKQKNNPKTFEANCDLFRNYKFVICFENSFEEEYITEKLPQAMHGNAVPIYRGAPNVSDYFNTKSFINYDDYGSYEEMIKKVIELDQDSKKYNDFLKQPWMEEKHLEKIREKKQVLKKFLKKVIDS